MTRSTDAAQQGAGSRLHSIRSGLYVCRSRGGDRQTPGSLRRTLLFFVLFSAWGVLRAQIDTQPSRRLSPEALQIAQQLGIVAQIEELRATDPTNKDLSMTVLVDRQEVLQQLLVGLLQIDKANAAIDSELEQIRVIQAELSARRDRAQGKINVASIISGTVVGIVATSLQFKSSTANVGNGIGIAGGATSVTLSIAALHEQGGRQLLGDTPLMLAPLLERSPNPTVESGAGYPRIVWNYLNSVPPDDVTDGTRRQRIVAKWQREGRIPANYGLDSVTTGHPLRRAWSIDELNNLYSMLLDTKATISQMETEMSDLMDTVVVARPGTL